MKHIWTRILSLLLLSSATALYAQTPSWQWGRRGGAPSSLGPNREDNVIDMATDPNGNVYVLANNNKGAGINVDGHQSMNSNDAISVASWDCNGNFRWMKTYGGASVYAVAIRTDTLGGVYVAGSVQCISAPAYLGDTTLPYTNKTMFLIKYDTMGGLVWLKMPQPDTISVTGASYSGIQDMDVAPNGDIFLYCLLTPGNYDNNAFVVNEMKMYVVRYNTNGLFASLTPLDITVSGTWQHGYGYGNLGGFNRKFSCDYRSGRYYLAGSYDPDIGTLSFGNTTFPDTSKFYLAAFDNAGNSLWTKINTGTGNNGIISRPAIDEQGNVYICGGSGPPLSFNGYTFVNSFGQYGAPFIIAVDSNGNLLWGTNGEAPYQVPIAAAIVHVNNTVAVDGSYATVFKWGSLEVTGPSAATPPKYIYLARFNAASGNIIGLDSIPSNAFNTLASAIAADKNNNFYVGGQFGNELYSGGDTLHNWGGMYDWFVAKFGSANCNCDIPQPNFSYNTTGSNTYAFNYTGSTPYTGISWDFGDGAPASSGNANPVHTYAASGTYHVCVTVTNNCGSNTYCKTINIDGTGIQGIPGFANILIYPNPATQEIVIEQAAAGTALDIYNVTGRRLLHRVLKGSKDRINVGNLPSGIYLMRFRDKEGHQGSHKFVKR